MTAKFIIQRREVDRTFSNPYGSGLKYTKWKSISKHVTPEEAVEELENKSQTGLAEFRIKFKTFVVYKFEHGRAIFQKMHGWKGEKRFVVELEDLVKGAK